MRSVLKNITIYLNLIIYELFFSIFVYTYVYECCIDMNLWETHEVNHKLVLECSQIGQNGVFIEYAAYVGSILRLRKHTHDWKSVLNGIFDLLAKF